MPLLRLPEPFDHPEWLFEIKHDGFRALAHIDGHHCDLVSRNGHTFKHWPHLCEELAHAVTAHDAVIDGEIVCLDARGAATSSTCCSGASGPTSTRLICSQSTAKTCESG
jgi:ATP-dependent DNA ligase